MKRLLCYLFGHRWGQFDVQDIELLDEYSLFSQKGIQRAFRKCSRCQREETVKRTGLVGFGGPLSPSSCTDWIQE